MKSIVAAAGIIAICYGAFVVTLWRARDRDISRFVVAGGPGVDAREVPPGLTVRKELGGYDGMALYRLALNPFTNEQKAHGIALDNPSYRQQRIGYPLLVFIASFGNARWVPAALVIVNVIALIAMAAIGGALARQFGFSGLWGIVFPLYPGFVLTLSRDTSEIVACTFMLAVAYALARERWIVAAILLTCATLTRETSLVIAIALAVVYVWRRERQRRGRAGVVLQRLRHPPDPSLSVGMRAITFALPISVYVCWQIALMAVWHRLPVAAGAPAIAFPFSEFAKFLAAAAPRRIYIQRLYFMESIYLALLVIIVVVIWRRSSAAIEWRVAWLGYLIVAAIMPHSIWIEDFGFLRIFGDLCLVSAVLIVASTVTARWLALIASAVLWFHLAQHVIELH